ncbi:MAG: hypothetical protein KBD26_02625 [Candidatus Pacebacteria bacterium]|nr:hypothetical protein [Candidatus Paceibacterota bacterium]MBP9772705.1 hypothetical protein [Candidatus Paceibacterota bacterium]
MDPKHPLKYFRLSNGYPDVQKLALDLAGTKTRGKIFKKFSVLIYKIEEDKEVSIKRIEFLIEEMKNTLTGTPKEVLDLLKYEILFWRYFPENRKIDISRSDILGTMENIFNRGYYTSRAEIFYFLQKK